MHRDSWTIGELATECGLTVRALRHFEDKGLLRPIDRTPGGHRSYGRADVEQVYRIVALRALGLPLAQIAEALESPPALAQSLRDQLAHVDHELADLSALRVLLQRAVSQSEDNPIAVEELITVIHQTAVSQDLLREYLDDADLALLAHRGAELGDEATRIVHTDYPRLYQAAHKQLVAGTPPDAPVMQEIAAQMEALSQRLSGSDSPSDKVQKMWRDHSEEITGRDYTDLSDYVMVARTLHRQHREG